MISIDKQENCCGCGACAESCPKKCISLVADDEGFLYPKVNEDLCIHCSLCEKVCPINNRSENSVLSVYAAQNKDKDVRAKSSSGGTFRLLAERVISRGGIVYGCVFDRDMVARHVSAEKIEELDAFLNSKYVQSTLDGIFVDIKKQLNDGKDVLFSGTPCQVAGLKNFLHKEYETLFTVDLLCHGVPSPKVFADYKSYMEKRFGGKMVSLNLRDKKKSWKRLYVHARFDNGKRYFTFCGYDSYLSMFLKNISLRPSCYACRFTTTNRQGDITLGDFWGIGNHIRRMDDDKGTSLIIVNTEKGKEEFDAISSNLKLVETNIETAIAGNKVLKVPTKKSLRRDDFYRTYIESGYKTAAKKYAGVPAKPKQIYYNAKRKAADIYRFIFRKTY